MTREQSSVLPIITQHLLRPSLATDIPQLTVLKSVIMAKLYRNSFRRYASFRSNLNEILYEEDEEEDIMEEKQSKETRIPFSFRSTFDI